MSGRTFVIGDIHGEREQLELLLEMLPPMDPRDTLVLLGDYVDRGPESAQVVDYVRRRLPRECPAQLVALRGNHEDGWLRVRGGNLMDFVRPKYNGCLATLRSYMGGLPPVLGDIATEQETLAMMAGFFWPDEALDWMAARPCWYEDEHAIYVHAELPWNGQRWVHPSELDDPTPLLWLRTGDFPRRYRGKRVIFGHTVVENLPQELSSYTPDDPTDLFVGEDLVGIDTGCGRGGFLTAIELPSCMVYESRSRLTIPIPLMELKRPR